MRLSSLFLLGLAGVLAAPAAHAAPGRVRGKQRTTLVSSPQEVPEPKVYWQVQAERAAAHVGGKLELNGIHSTIVLPDRGQTKPNRLQARRLAIRLRQALEVVPKHGDVYFYHRTMSI